MGVTSHISLALTPPLLAPPLMSLTRIEQYGLRGAPALTLTPVATAPLLLRPSPHDRHDLGGSLVRDRRRVHRGHRARGTTGIRLLEAL